MSGPSKVMILPSCWGLLGSRIRTLTRSSGCVTHAAMLLALPPNQKGYRMEGACFSSFLASAGRLGAEAVASFSDCMTAVMKPTSYKYTHWIPWASPLPKTKKQLERRERGKKGALVRRLRRDRRNNDEVEVEVGYSRSSIPADAVSSHRQDLLARPVVCEDKGRSDRAVEWGRVASSLCMNMGPWHSGALLKWLIIAVESSAAGKELLELLSHRSSYRNFVSQSSLSRRRSLWSFHGSLVAN